MSVDSAVNMLKYLPNDITEQILEQHKKNHAKFMQRTLINMIRSFPDFMISGFREQIDEDINTIKKVFRIRLFALTKRTLDDGVIEMRSGFSITILQSKDFTPFSLRIQTNSDNIIKYLKFDTNYSSQGRWARSINKLLEKEFMPEYFAEQERRNNAWKLHSNHMI